MIDEKTATKRAYDLAAEAFCEHVAACPDCSMPRRTARCPVGTPLGEAENAAWYAYYRARYGERRL